ncbi:MAG TPA: CehA/McbA family metallohydrolase [Streptosporangiaceae bacterium]|nr:CehA/McbA family metallohydrolase [Streptosporangiaceae bacterium]
MALTRHAGTWTIEDRCESTWHYLPFEVPAGSSALRVELDYDAAGTVLDLGCFGPAGFRGWSGGARRSFVIGAMSATPGYLPGELEPGTWTVVLGLHWIPAAGARYAVSAEVSAKAAGQAPGDRVPGPGTEPVPPRASQRARRELPADDGMRWLAGDLHAHTVHSDGLMTVPELARFAAGRGLEFLAVTDHNTISHHAELRAAASAHGITLLAGQELTTEQGHANAFGDIGWVDFREPPDEWLAMTERHGGLLSVNHPYGGHVSWTAPMKRRPPLLEVWHWSWLDPRWTTPLAWWLAWDPAATAVGGSDWHRPGSDAPPGSPTTWVQAESADDAAVLGGLAAGRVAISAGRDGPVLLRVDGELVACGGDGTILAGPDGPKRRVRGDLARFTGDAGHHRLVDPSGATLALTG